MTTLERYIGRVLLANFAVALSGLVAIFSVIQLAQEAGDIDGAYSVTAALRYLLLMVPSEAYELFAAAALVGGVSGLGQLAAQNEIVAMWSAGVSRGRVIRAVLQVAALLAAGAVALGELLAAPLAQDATMQRSIALSAGKAMSTERGFWARDGLRFINIRGPVTGELLADVHIYELDAERHMSAFKYARSASYSAGGWKLQDVTESRFTGSEVVTEKRLSEPWATFRSAKQLRRLTMPPEHLSSTQLLRTVRSLRERGESPRRYELALAHRAMLPLAAVVMLFLSVPLVLAAHGRARIGQRIVLAALLGIGFQMVSQTFTQAALVYELPPALAVLTLPLLALAAALRLLRQTP